MSQEPKNTSIRLYKKYFSFYKDEYEEGVYYIIRFFGRRFKWFVKEREHEIKYLEKDRKFEIKYLETDEKFIEWLLGRKNLDQYEIEKLKE